MSEQVPTSEKDAAECAGYSARGMCGARVRFEVVSATAKQFACGRHVGWLLGRMLPPGATAYVTRVTPPGSDQRR